MSFAHKRSVGLVQHLAKSTPEYYFFIPKSVRTSKSTRHSWMRCGISVMSVPVCLYTFQVSLWSFLFRLHKFIQYWQERWNIAFALLWVIVFIESRWKSLRFFIVLVINTGLFMTQMVILYIDRNVVIDINIIVIRIVTSISYYLIFSNSYRPSKLINL